MFHALGHHLISFSQTPRGGGRSSRSSRSSSSRNWGANLKFPLVGAPPPPPSHLPHAPDGKCSHSEVQLPIPASYPGTNADSRWEGDLQRRDDMPSFAFQRATIEMTSTRRCIAASLLDAALMVSRHWHAQSTVDRSRWTDTSRNAHGD